MIYYSLLWCLFASFAIARAQLSFSPAGPYCDGDTVTFTCILEPAGSSFFSIEANIRFANDSNTCYIRSQINSNNTGPINSTRYTHLSIVPGIGSPNASAVLEINPFQAVDASMPFSCCVPTSGTTFISNSISPILAVPPYPANVSLSATYDSATSCTGTITLTWLAVTSDRTVTSYEVLLNGTNIATSSPTAGTNTYTTASMSLAPLNGRYTVRAVSCAGSSVSNEEVFTPPTSPPAANMSISTTYNSSTSCTGTITLTWLAVTSDRAVTSYEILLNGTTIATISPTAGTNTYTTSSMSLDTFNGTYTVRAVSCAGSSVSNEVVFTPPTSLTPPSITYITGKSPYIVFSIASTGIISAYYIHINGSTDKITPNTIYDLYIYTGSLIPMYGDYNFSISAGNCVGNSSNSNSLFIIGDATPTISTTTTANTIITTTTTNSIATVTLSTSSSPTTTLSSTTPLTTTTPVIPPSSCTCTCTNYTNADICNTNTTQSSLTTLTTSGTTSEQSSNSISYVAVIVILAILLLVAIIIIIILIVCIIYSWRKPKNENKNNVGSPAKNPTDAVHIYNYIDLNDIPQTPNTQHHYTEMHSANICNIPEYVNSNDNNNNNEKGNDRSTYANLA